MNRITRVSRSMAEAVLDGVGRIAGRVQEASFLPTDLLEDDDEYLIVFDAPGAVASDVQVRYRRSAVEVRIDRFRDHHDGFEMRFPGRGMALDGRVRLPDDAQVDPAEATATLRDNGTLEVRLPKRQVAPETRTSVTVEEGESEA